MEFRLLVADVKGSRSTRHSKMPPSPISRDADEEAWKDDNAIYLANDVLNPPKRPKISYDESPKSTSDTREEVPETGT